MLIFSGDRKDHFRSLIFFKSLRLSAKRTNLVAVGSAHGSRSTHSIDPVRVEQINSINIVRHIRFHIRPKTESILPEMTAYDGAPSGSPNIVATLEDLTCRQRTRRNHPGNESL
jgi:hypothetical protein